MLLSLGIALALVALVSMLVMRGTVGFLARGADNGWDNAFTYVLVSGAAWAALVHFVMPLGLFAFVAACLFIPVLQVGALRWIYEIRAGRALVVAIVSTTATTTIITGLTLLAGVIAAYIMYGRVIDDPMILVRIILRLIGLLPGSVEG